MDKKIVNYLNTYEDLFSEMSNHDPPLPVMDVSMKLINEKDYYGCNFSKNNMYMLFFTGQSNYFPGIYIVKNVNLDECPIFIIDTSSKNEPIYVGNFRKYIKTLLKWFSEIKKDNKKIKDAQLDLNMFSNKIFDIKLKMNEIKIEKKA